MGNLGAFIPDLRVVLLIALIILAALRLCDKLIIAFTWPAGKDFYDWQERLIGGRDEHDF